MARAQPFIQSVLGPIDPGELGQTLLHEHLVADWDFARGMAPQMTSTAVVPELVACLKAAHAAGLRSLVDVSPESWALSPLLIAIVARESPVHVVAATGCWKPLALPLPGWAYPPSGPEEIADHFVEAFENGLGGTGVKPGIISVATDAGPTNPVERNILEGAALAQRATGLAITTHTSSPACAEAHVDILGEAGADMDRVAIGRLGLRSGLAGFPLYERLAKVGVGLGIDNFGMVRQDSEWADMTVQLIDAGYVDNVILSLDTTVIRRGMEGIYNRHTLKDTKNIVGLEQISEVSDRPTEGDFTLLHTRLLPLLRKAGVEEETITRILVDNPTRMLTIDPARYPEAGNEPSVPGRQAAET